MSRIELEPSRGNRQVPRTLKSRSNSSVSHRPKARQVSVRRQIALARRGNLLVGCLAVLGVVILLALIGGVIVYMNWKGWTASAMNAGMKAAVQESQLPAEQVGRINTQIDQLTGAFESGDVTMEDLASVIQVMEDHPILPIGVLEYIEYNSLRAAGITDEERAAGARATQRLQRAMVEGKMVLEDIEPVLEPVSQRGPDGNIQPLQNPTAPQVRLYIEGAKNKADELGIPDEDYDVDVAEQIEDLINDTLGREVVSAPPAEGASPPAPAQEEGAGEAEPADPAEPTEPAEAPGETSGGG